ncbi:MAG: hypothetical protein QXP60_08925 [Nitrososphaerota archaeon]
MGNSLFLKYEIKIGTEKIKIIKDIEYALGEKVVKKVPLVTITKCGIKKINENKNKYKLSIVNLFINTIYLYF